MIHTMYITSKLNRTQFNEIYDSITLLSGIKPYAPDENTEQNKIYITYYRKPEGLSRIVLRKFNTDTIQKYSIEIQLNPKRLIEKDNHTLLLQESDIIEVIQEFDDIVHEIHYEFPSFIMWKVNRIDYAVNIYTEHVKLYIELFQRANRPNIHYDGQYSNVLNKTIQKEGSFYLISKSVRLNFYDKQKQLIGESANSEDILSAKNILRIEVQCLRGKVNQIVRTDNDVINTELFNFLPKELSREIITNYFNHTIGDGDYYSLDAARKIINAQENITPSTKDKLIKHLKLINQKTSIWKAKELYGNNRLFNNYIKQLRAIGINPVTIPREREVPHLSNLKSVIIETLTPLK